jgi:hypothetical protein
MEQNKLRNFLKKKVPRDCFISWDVSGQVLIAFDDEQTGFQFLAVTYRFFSSPRRLEKLGAHPTYFPMATGKIFPHG